MRIIIEKLQNKITCPKDPSLVQIAVGVDAILKEPAFVQLPAGSFV